MKTEFRCTEKGTLYVEQLAGTTFAVRPVPPRCWASRPDGSPLWEAKGAPRFSLGEALRELHDEDCGRPVDDSPESVDRREDRRLFFACIDEATKTELARWSHGTWELYRLLVSSPDAQQMAKTEEGRRLVWVAAQADMLFEPPWKKARALPLVKRLLRRPRKEIVGALGFPPTESTVRAIGRIVPANMSRKALRMLSWALADEKLRKRMAHLPQLSGVVLGTLTSHHLAYVGDSLLHELAADDLFEEEGGLEAESVHEVLGDSVVCAEQIGRKVPVFQSRKALMRFFDEVTLDWRRGASLPNDPLPEVPDVFTPEERSWVRPLRTLAEWGAEGRELRHCLAASEDHCRRATAGTLAAWALEGPERLTFAAQRDDGGVWQFFDLRGEQNRPPSANARAWADDVVARLNGKGREQ